MNKAGIETLFYEVFPPEIDLYRGDTSAPSQVPQVVLCNFFRFVCAGHVQPPASSQTPLVFLFSFPRPPTRILITPGSGGTSEQTSLHNQSCTLHSNLVLM